MDLVRALFAVDATGPDAVFAGWHDPGNRWNGWACPEFDRAEAERVIAWAHAGNAAGDPEEATTFTWDGDVLIETGPAGNDRYTDRIEPNVRGRYPIGDGWTWTEVTVPAWADLGEYLAMSNRFADAMATENNRENDRLLAAGVGARERYPLLREAGARGQRSQLLAEIADLMAAADADPGRAVETLGHRALLVAVMTAEVLTRLDGRDAP